MAKSSNWNKFRLLLWKNWILQRSHKFQLIIELIVPALFLSLIILLRVLIENEHQDIKKYATLPINTLDLFRKHMLEQSSGGIPNVLLYSPENEWLDKIVKSAADSLGISKYEACSDAKDLEHRTIASNGLAGIQFDQSLAEAKGFPDNLKYTLRFPSELRTVSSYFPVTWLTLRLYPVLQTAGPRNKDDADGGVPVGYLREGFLPIQNALSMSYLRLRSPGGKLPDVMLQRYPYTAYEIDQMNSVLGSLLVFVITVSFIYSCACITKSITAEKEKQLKEVMLIMGIDNWLHWAAWMVKSFIMLFASAFIIIAMLKIPSANGAVLNYSNFFVLLLYMAFYLLNVICFCFMLATFFNTASTAAAVSGLVFFLSYLPMSYISNNYSKLSAATKLCWCLFTNTAMGMGFLQIVEFEGAGIGLQFSNLFSPVNVDDNISVGLVMIMMVVSSVLYMLICLYMEQIHPGEFGVARPWYFPFTRSFWCKSNRNNYMGVENLSETDLHRNQGDKRSFEQEPENMHIGVQVRNLKKRYGDKMAVKGLSINMFENEITVLLGHNGAGKTTTIAMLTGMFPPTSGTAIVNGSDIRTNLRGARMSLGICPQHNVLFDEMSVADHLRFYTRIKGLSKPEVEAEVTKYLKLIELEDKKNAPSSTLSGGMKRKLSVCCALSGNTKVVFFDEPSSGMDPAARRQLWELLLKEKAGRTILLSTHFMDEADVLGDRIAIMCDGELRCYGTSFFLKKYYGCGYKLICVKEDNCDVSRVTALLNKYIPGIQPESDIGSELTYKLPDNYSDRFEEMLSKLDKQLSDLHLNGFGVGITSLEDVFMKVGAESNANPINRSPGGGQNDTYNTLHQNQIKEYDEHSIQSEGVFLDRNSQLQGLKLSVNQLNAMMLKNMLLTWSRKVVMALQIIIPMLLVIAAILIMRSSASYGPLPAMKIELTQYPNAVTVLDRTALKDKTFIGFADQYEKLAKSYGVNYEFQSTEDQNFSDFILNIGKTMQTRVNFRYQAAATISDGNIIAWLNNQPLHTAPLTVNLLHNAMARHLLGENTQIEVTNYPLPYSTKTVLAQLSMASSSGVILSTNLCFSFCFVTTMYIVMLIKERVSRAKLLQFVSGVRIWTFWLSQFTWDIFTLGVTILVTLLVIACFQEDGFSTAEELSRYLAVLIVFGCSALPMTYVLSLFFKDPSFAFIVVSMANVFFGLAMILIYNVMAMEVFNIVKIANTLAAVCRVFPHFSLAMGLNKLYVNYGTRQVCDKINSLPPVLVCELMPQCCRNVLKDYFAWAAPGILKEIVYLAATAVIFFAVLIISELKIFTKIRLYSESKTYKPPPPLPENYFEDDVEKERQRILAMTQDEISVKNLVLDRVTKMFGRFKAVNEVSICVKEMECFGLLGVNGAGKTTTFKMLTGDENITTGNVYVQGLSMKNDLNEIYKRIGYCPQFDALLDGLTGRQMLRIFSLLRGIPSSQIKHISEDLANLFGFAKHLDKETRHYSGGNKRKLSAAIALMGSPPVAYMDEPTTGMDPAARRSLWNIVCRVRDFGKSIVLTSHSMEECEALCTRLAIMVNGELKCIGSTQHLKNKYSKGIVLKIKLRSPNRAPVRTPGETSIKLRRVTLDDSSPPTPVPYANSSDTSIRQSRDNVQIAPRASQDLNRKLENDHSDTISTRRNSDAINSDNAQRENSQLVKDFVLGKFPLGVLQEEHLGMLTFYIPLDAIKWSELFGFMELNRESLNVEDYSINQTTLEEIFLEFAKQQRDDRRTQYKAGCCNC